MELTDELYRKIFRYIDNEMSETEKLRFDKMVNANRELKKEVAFYQEIRLLSDSISRKVNNFTEDQPAIPDADSVVIKKARQQWEAKNEIRHEISLPGDQQTKYIRIRKLAIWEWLAAASVIGMITVFAVTLFLRPRTTEQQVSEKKDLQKPGIDRATQKNTAQKNANKPDSAFSTPATLIPSEQMPLQADRAEATHRILAPEQLAAVFISNFKIDDIPEETGAELRDAFDHYRESRFEEAIASFSERELLSPRGYEENQPSVAFYAPYFKGISYLAIDSAGKAISELNAAIITSPDAYWKTKTKWYLALAYVKNGKRENAIKLLRTISSTRRQPDMAGKARKVLDEIE